MEPRASVNIGAMIDNDRRVSILNSIRSRWGDVDAWRWSGELAFYTFWRFVTVGCCMICNARHDTQSCSRLIPVV